MEKLKPLTTSQVEEYPSVNTFRFGSGAMEVSERACRIPVAIGQKHGLIDAAIIQGQAPLLLGRPTLEKLDVTLDFKRRIMTFLDQKVPVAMRTNAAGQLLIDILNFSQDRQPQEPKSASVTPQSQTPEVGTTSSHILASECPKTPECPKPPVCPPEFSRAHQPKLKRKACRCLLAQVRRQEPSRTAVAELFCPPRFAEEARSQGATGFSFDIKGGWDLLHKPTQQRVSALLDEARPSLLVCCPPCTHMGGWESLNRCYRTAIENARMMHVARSQVRYCVQEIHKQLRHGGDFLFEHPIGSRVWRLPEMQGLVRKFGVHRVDMCA